MCIRGQEFHKLGTIESVPRTSIRRSCSFLGESFNVLDGPCSFKRQRKMYAFQLFPKPVDMLPASDDAKFIHKIFQAYVT